MLDDAGGCDCRMIFRRKRDEPRVIFELIWRLVFGLVFARWPLGADDLSGASLAAHDHILEMRLVRGATRAVDNICHRVLNGLQRGWIDRDSSLNFGRI